MKNPIKIRNFDISDQRLKLIACNIIDYIAAKENLNVDHIFFNKDDDFSCNYLFDLEERVLSNDINVAINDYHFLFEGSVIKKDSFYKSYNIYDDLDLAEFVFIVIHENGHAILNHYCFNRLSDRPVNFNRFNDIMKNTIAMCFPIRKDTEDSDMVFNYYFEPIEQYATTYAYQNFYEVWCMLKYRGLI